MTRFALRTCQHGLDLLVLSLAFALAFGVRFDFDLPYAMFKRFLFLWPYVVALEIAILHVAGVPRYAWRYVGVREATRIALAIGASSSVLLVARVGAGLYEATWSAATWAVVPYGVIIVNFALAFLGVAGSRFAWRALVEGRSRRRHRGGLGAGAATLLVGAGRAGVQVSREIGGRPDLGLNPVAFVDDDPAKLGQVLNGVPVRGRTEDIAKLVREHAITEVVITIASASGADIRRIVSLCEDAHVTAKIIPGISEILDGKVALSRIRAVSIEDLLGREAVQLERDLVQTFVRGRTIVVTGAGGSIGSELCRQIARVHPARLVLIERAEPALFTVTRELRLLYPDLRIEAALADVSDAPRIDALFARHRPDVVFHAAAHKHVPLMEDNPGEAIKNNVFGTKVVADAASKAAVGTFVFVSTDKAVNPTSIMGASKRVAEVYMQAMAQSSSTHFVAVRFGNVLGSAGSVIPIFQRQIQAGGPVTVTHPKMKRYFMTIPEASQLVMQAGAMGAGGEIFVLDMGEPVRIVDLAYDLIKLSGFEPGVDIPVVFSGVRPGEKLFEELGFDAELMDKTRHPKIFVGRLRAPELDEVHAALQILEGCIEAHSRRDVMDALRILVPEMQDDARKAPRTSPGLPRTVSPAPPLATAK